MNGEASDKQKNLIRILCKQNGKEYTWSEDLSKEAADGIIKSLIAEIKNDNGKDEVKDKQIVDKNYPISFQLFLKSACILYAGKGLHFDKVVEEVKEVY